jgi:hypothetical protein
MSLDGRVALVLGAIKGIGKGIGLALADAGVNVALNYYDWDEELEALSRDFAETGQAHLIVQTNLPEIEKIPGLIRSVMDRFGRLDILVNNIERGGWPVVHGPYIIKDAPFMTGSVLRLDGGYVLGGDEVGEMPEGVLYERFWLRLSGIATPIRLPRPYLLTFHPPQEQLYPFKSKF